MSIAPLTNSFSFQTTSADHTWQTMLVQLDDMVKSIGDRSELSRKIREFLNECPLDTQLSIINCLNAALAVGSDSERLHYINIARIQCAKKGQGEFEQSFTVAILKEDCHAVETLLSENISRPDLVITSLPGVWEYHAMENPIIEITALGLACFLGNISLVRLLMRRNADPNLFGYSPAWLILLCAPIPVTKKMQIWSEFQGKGDITARFDEHTLWLSKALGAYTLQPEALHEVLMNIPNILEKIQLNHAEWAFDSEEETPPYLLTAYHHYAVLICHGLLPSCFDMPELSGMPFSLNDLQSFRCQFEDDLVEALSSQNEEARAQGANWIDKDSWQIVRQYAYFPADAIRKMVAQVCFKKFLVVKSYVEITELPPEDNNH